MSDDKVSEMMRDALLAEKDEPVPEEEIEECLPYNAVLNPSGYKALKEGRAQFARMMLESLHPEPIREIEGNKSLGQWLKETREKASLSSEMIAAALGKDEYDIDELESGEIKPNQILNSSDAANLSELFRVTFPVILRLIQNSSYSEEPWWYGALLYPQHNHLGGFRGDKSPPNSIPSETDMDMYHWLYDLRKELEKREAHNLLE